MSADDTLVDLLRALKARNYRFTAITPASHKRVLARDFAGPPTLRDIFGWSRAFRDGDLDVQLMGCLEAAAMLQAAGDGYRSKVRVASLNDELFLHSAFPTDAADCVFFGPDTYRFVRWLEAATFAEPPRGVIDMGAGSGAGGIAIGRRYPDATITLVDINPTALRFAAINAAAAGVPVAISRSARIPAGADLIVANPPYMIDASGRSYRDGGDLHGGAVALDWARQAIAVLKPGGRMLLYTGAAIVDGGSPLLDALRSEADRTDAMIQVDELDPDVFGEELEVAAYADVERIAVLGVTIRKQ